MSDAVIREIVITDKQRELIERYGVFMDRSSSGFSPVESRIIGLLIISDIIELTFEEIQNILSISKGATSNAINRLLKLEKIEYITKPGERKRYFRIALDRMEERTKEQLTSIYKIGELYTEILEQRTDATPQLNDKLAKLVSLIKFLEVELPILLERWKKEFLD